MYDLLSPICKSRLAEYCRCFRSQLVFDEFTIESEDIQSIVTDGGSTTTQVAAPGEVVSQTLTAKLLNVDKSLEGKAFQWFIYLYDYDNPNGATHSALSQFTNEQLSQMTHAQLVAFGADKIPMGKFFVESCKKEGESYTLECFDALGYADAEYVSGLTYPALLSAIEDEICTKLGIPATLSESVSAFVTTDGKAFITSDDKTLKLQTDIRISRKPQGYTMREMLSFIASLKGCFAVLDRNGNLVFKWYEYAKELDENTYDAPTIAENKVTYTRLNCTVGDTTLTAGQGVKALSFENPYMTQAVLDSLVSRLLPFSVTAISVVQRCGDPRLDPWDIVTVGNVDVPLMQLSFDYDGGLQCDFESTNSDGTESIATIKQTVQRTSTNSSNSVTMSEVNDAIYAAGFVTQMELGEEIDSVNSEMDTLLSLIAEQENYIVALEARLSALEQAEVQPEEN